MIAEDLLNLNTNNIIINEPIKNSLIQYNYFYKLSYSNEFIIFNNIYCLLLIDDITVKNNYAIINNPNNIYLEKLIRLEKNILDHINSNKSHVYKIKELLNSNLFKFSTYENEHFFNVPDISNIDCTSNICDIGEIGEIGDMGNIGNIGNIGDIRDIGDIGDIGDMGNIRDVGNIGDNKIKNTQKFIIKLSGIWESKETIGLTFKFILIKNNLDFYPSVEKKAKTI